MQSFCRFGCFLLGVWSLPGESKRKYLLRIAQVSDVVVDEGTLGVHQIELVVDAGEDFGNGSAV